MAAVMEVEEKLKDITDCPICLETFKEPKILPCIHTFCMNCLRETGEKLKKNPGDSMPCPVCRKEFTVPETGFGGLQKNFFMDKLTELKNILQPSSSRILCNACLEDKGTLAEGDHIPSAEMYCVQCHHRLCSDCCKHHRKNKITKNHKIISTEGQQNFKLDDLQETLTSDSCEKHQHNLLEIYCSDCQEVVCSICFVENHQSHVGADINKVATDFRKNINANIDNFSLLVPELKQVGNELEKYKTELMLCTEEIQVEVSKRRQELKELVDKHADSILLELDSIRQQNIKKCELDKENIETLLVCLESYKAYCLQLNTVGSASDICRAKSALDVRTKELKQLHGSTGNISYQLSYVSLKLTDLYDRLGSPNENIIGKLEEVQSQNSESKKTDLFESSPDALSDKPHEENLDMEKPTDKTSKQNVEKLLPTQEKEEDEEDNEELVECLKWKLDSHDVEDSIELQCLSDLETMLKSKLKHLTTEESALHDKLSEVKQKVTGMLGAIKTLRSELENERLRLEEVQQERDLLAERIKEHKSNEQTLSIVIEDLKKQVALLSDLNYGEKQATKTKGNITYKKELTFIATLEKLSKNLIGYKVFGIAILENELFVVGSDSLTVVYDLTTLKFRRRWKVPREGTYEAYDDVKLCNANKCLYMMKVDSKTFNEIIRLDPKGNEIVAWSVEKARGLLSVTSESNILLTASSLNQLHEYTPDGKLVQVINVPWSYGIENPSHAIKLTSDHFLVCHGKDGGPFVRVCIMESSGNVLKYFGDLWKTDRLKFPIYLEIDGGGNILVADRQNGRLILLSSNLEFKQNLSTPEVRHPNDDSVTESYPKKICFDESNGRMFMVEHFKKRVFLEGIVDRENVSAFKI